jgi:Tol biopolymer transport system component
MSPRTLLLVAAVSMPVLGCSASLRRGVTTTDAATAMEQVTRSSANELDPAVSPDGKTLAFEVADTPDAAPHIEGVRIDGAGVESSARILYGPGHATGREPAWMPDGSSLVYLSGSGGSYRLVQTFGPRPDQTAFLADAGDPGLPGMWPAMSPDGKRMAMSVPRLDLFRTGWRADRSFDAALGISDLSGTGVTILGEGSSPAWSPDGQRLAFARRTDGRAHLFVAGADGGRAVQLTYGAQDDVEPAWSPDGATLAFCSTEVGEDGRTHSNIFVVQADGSGLQQLTEGDRTACRPSWARDGFIYFHVDATERFHIWRIRRTAGDGQGRERRLRLRMDVQR